MTFEDRQQGRAENGGGIAIAKRPKSLIPTHFKSKLIKEVDGGSESWAPVLRALPEPLRQQLTSRPAAKKRKRAPPPVANGVATADGEGVGGRREVAGATRSTDDGSGPHEDEDVVMTGFKASTSGRNGPAKGPSPLAVVIMDSDDE